MTQSGDHLDNRQVERLLREALNHLVRNDFPAAEHFLGTILSVRPTEADALHLFGQMRRVQKRFGEAEEYYCRTLAIQPSRPEVHYHLGQLYHVQGRLDEAIASLREAVRLKPNFTEAHLELGFAFSKKQDFQNAENAYREVLRLQPNLLSAKQALSATLIGLGRHKEAETIARAALAQAPRDPRWHAALKHNLGISLSEQQRYEEAIHAFDDVQALAPDLPLADYNRANTLQSMGRISEAETAYARAISRDPLDYKAHRALNELLYRMERPEFLDSYDVAAKAHPESAELFAEKGKLLLLSGRYEEACENFARTLKLAPDHAVARDGLGSALTRLGRFSQAAGEYEILLARHPSDVDVRCNFVESLLRAGDTKKGIEIAEETLTLAPYNQLTLALWGTAMRQSGDVREEELNNYEEFVQVCDLDPPEGFSDMESFNRALNAYLDRLHWDRREHINQTSRMGTKTAGKLFGANHNLVEGLKKRIDDAVSTYIAHLKESEAHPLHARRTREFLYSGSWSTRLSDHGFHTNHVHPKGWISSA
ncbi:MAG TPA: tetratricopeptide repeat protein, partial [Rhizomicrobium sp.]